MARFQLNKGERFVLKKSEGLNNLTVSLGWKGGADLDACAFLLGEDGTILNEANFVFYNSTNREEEFSLEKFGDKKAWMKKTRPMSADGSVLGSLDDLGDDDDDNGDSSEVMTVDLSKVDGKVRQIVFCVSVYKEKTTFGSVNAPSISIANDDNGEEVCRYDLKVKFQNETAVVAGRLVINEDGDWSFEAVGKGYFGGMQALIHVYVSKRILHAFDLNKADDDAEERRRPSPAPAPKLSPAPAPKPSEKQEEKGGKKWLWVIIALIAVAILAYFLLRGCSKDGAASAPVPEQVRTESVPEQPAPEAVVPEAEEQSSAPATAQEAEKPAPKPSAAEPAHKTVAPATSSYGGDDAMALRVIRGEFGNNPERRQRLGADYEAIQSRVNELMRK